MKRIKSQSIRKYLDKMGWSYQVHGNLNEEYTVASIYSPIDSGFYFLSKTSQITLGSESLTIVQKHLLDHVGAQIIVDKDPQIVYYKILKYHFERKSSGIQHESAIINGSAKIGANVQIDPFTILGDCEIGKNSVIGSNVHIEDKTNIGENVTIESGSIIGTSGVAWAWDNEVDEKILLPQLGGVTIGDNCFIGAQTIVARGSLNEKSIIGNDVYLAPGCRLGHGTVIKDHVHFANGVLTGGNTIIGNNSFIGSGAVLRPKVQLDDNTIVGAGSVVVKNTTQVNSMLKGVPAKESEIIGNPSGMPKRKKK
ncbi:MAG: hypothetical protein GY816_10775 [Cytophagales bacterium]|nr:hypothetical protein [Cytophagales bacterium]